MAKLSELSDGGLVQETDDLLALRAGGNVRVSMSGLAFQDPNAIVLTGGTINDTAVGNLTPSTGAFTVLTATSGALNGMTIGATTPAAGTFTSLKVDAPIPTLKLQDTDGASQIATIEQNGPILQLKSRDNTLDGSIGLYGNGADSPILRQLIAADGTITFYDDTGLIVGLTWNPATESLSVNNIDSTIIGGTTPAAGSFTNLNATNMDSTIIGATTPAAGTFTALNATSGINSTSIGAVTASTGRFSTLTAVTGMDSTIIGGTTPAAGSFTNLDATNMDSTIIGATTPLAGTFTSINSTTLNVTTTAVLPYDNTTSGLAASTVQSAIDEINVLLGGGNVGSQATFQVYEFIATAAQTTFNLFSVHAVNYIPNYIQVYLNGVMLGNADYTASDGINLVLNVGAEVNDVVSMVVLDSFNTATLLRVVSVEAASPDAAIAVDSAGAVVMNQGIENTVIGGTTPAAGTFTGVDIVGTGSQALTVSSAGGNSVASFTSTDQQAYISYVDDTTTGVNFVYAGAEGNDFIIGAGASEKVRVDSTGNVGIGVTPEAWGGTSTAVQVGSVGSIEDRNTEFIIGNNVYVNSTPSSRYITNDFASKYVQASGAHRWDIAASGTAGAAISFTQAMKLDSSGNLLVGKGTSNNAVEGVELVPGGVSWFTRDGGTVMGVNRLTDGGTLINCVAAGVTVGAIATNGGDLVIGTGTTGLMFFDAEDRVIPRNSTGAARDALISLGRSDNRFKDLHLSGIVNIGTSAAPTTSNFGTVIARSNNPGLIESNRNVGAGTEVATFGGNVGEMRVFGDGSAHPAGGVYLGGPAAANLLDDYEEGTFSPTLTPSTSGSIALNVGANLMAYTKIGDVVTIVGCLVLSGTTSPVGDSVDLTNLPFVTADLADTSGRIGATVTYNDGGVFSAVAANAIEGVTSLTIFRDASTFGVSDQLYFSFSYKTLA